MFAIVYTSLLYIARRRHATLSVPARFRGLESRKSLSLCSTKVVANFERTTFRTVRLANQARKTFEKGNVIDS